MYQIRPQRPEYISEENRYKMTRKERDYVQLLSERKRTKDQIKRMLYITTDVGMWKIRRRVYKYINLVIAKK